MKEYASWQRSGILLMLHLTGWTAAPWHTSCKSKISWWSPNCSKFITAPQRPATWGVPWQAHSTPSKPSTSNRPRNCRNAVRYFTFRQQPNRAVNPLPKAVKEAQNDRDPLLTAKSIPAALQDPPPAVEEHSVVHTMTEMPFPTWWTLLLPPSPNFAKTHESLLP